MDPLYSKRQTLKKNYSKIKNEKMDAEAEAIDFRQRRRNSLKVQQQ